MDKAIDWLLELPPVAVYLSIALFCWAEAAFFLGFVTPGEAAVVAAGILASRGPVDYLTLLVIVTLSTLLGNATGFFLGAKYGNDLLHSSFIERWLSTPIEKTQQFMLSHGEWAIVFGRVSTPTRVITPFLAGASGMIYKRFVVFDFFASLLWALLYLSLGFLLGESWGLIKNISGTAAILVLILFVAALVIRWLALWLAKNQLRVKAMGRLVLRATGTREIARSASPGLSWIVARFDPEAEQGLNLTICLIVLLSSLVAAVLILNQFYALWGVSDIDYPIMDWMANIRTDTAVKVAIATLNVFHWPGMVALFAVAAPVLFWKASAMAAFRLLIGMFGAAAIAWTFDHHVLVFEQAVAHFPPISAAVCAALLVHIAAISARIGSWTSGVWISAAGVFVLFCVALANVVSGWSAPLGVILGTALGAGWASLLELRWVVRKDPGADDEDSLGAA